MEAAEWNSVVNHLRANSSLSPPRLARNLFSPDLVFAVSVWGKDEARLSRIEDGHYLNTILELGPILVATAVRLEATLMRREMVGQPATPSSFIKSDKMVSTLNAWPAPSTLSFLHSQCHSRSLSLQTPTLTFTVVKALNAIPHYNIRQACWVWGF